MQNRIRRASAVTALGLAGLAAAAGTASAGTTPATARPTASAAALLRPVLPMAQHTPLPGRRAAALTAASATAPPTTADCEQWFAAACYDPGQLTRAYGLTGPAARLMAGRGATIGIVDPEGDPQIGSDLKTFDAAYHLPAPPSLRVIKTGVIPAPTTPDQQAGAEETALDVEYAHVMAPAARIVVVATPYDDSTEQSSMPAAMTGVRTAVDAGVSVISMSWGVGETNYPEAAGKPGDYSELFRERTALQYAAAHHVTMLAASGDTGTADPNNAGTALEGPACSWPADDPLVTGVGGTAMTLNAAGVRTAPDTAWSDPQGLGETGGGGLSAVFARPSYQQSVRGVVGGKRGMPDISMDGSYQSGPIIYSSYSPDTPPGWQEPYGTSVSSPLMAGVVADAAGLAGHPLGQINPALYRAAGSPEARKVTGLADVTSGNTSIAGFAGYPALPGYDLATGTGTVGSAPRLIATLALTG